jgi:hypothetical protein
LIGSSANDCSTDTNSDGFVTIDDCSDDSYYKNLLLRDASRWAWGSEHGVEISRAFQRHASDGNPDTAGDQRFPWRDDVTNLSQNGPFIPLEYPATLRQINLSYGPDAYALPSWSGSEGRLSFDYVTDGGTRTDIDKFTIFGREGEHYVIETHSLVSTDTVIEIRDRWWAGAVQECGGGTSSCVDDDGGTGLASKLDFFPSETGWYRLYVSPFSTQDCGPETQYQLRLSIVDDDFGDALGAANPIPIDTTTKHGTIDSSSDYDWFYFYAPSAGTLTYFVCSDDNIELGMRLYDANGTLLAGSPCSNQSCSEDPEEYSLSGPGLYYARIARRLGDSSGDYDFNLYMSATDLDNDTKATAFDMSNLSSAPYVAVATDLDSGGSDEDWFKFEADEREHWAIATFSLGYQVDTIMELYAEDGSGMEYGTDYILSDDDGGYDDQYASRIVFTAPRSGDYYVRVRESSGVGGGTYSISATYNGTSLTEPPAFP